MALPSSGQLSISQIRDEEVNNGGYASTYSLRQLSSNAGFSTPDSISEFYGYGLVTSGLVLNLFTNGTVSYPGSGTTWNDTSGGGRNASMYRGTVPYVSGTPGYFDYNGGDYGFIGNTTLNNVMSNAITIQAVASITNLSQRTFLLNKYTGGTISGYVLEVGTISGLWTNTLRFYAAGTGGQSNDYRGTTAISANVVYLLTVTYDRNTGVTVFYANTSTLSANQAGSNAVASDWSQSTTNYIIGTFQPAGANYGYMRHYSTIIYNRALSASEVTANYNFLKRIYPIS